MIAVQNILVPVIFDPAEKAYLTTKEIGPATQLAKLYPADEPTTDDRLRPVMLFECQAHGKFELIDEDGAHYGWPVFNPIGEVVNTPSLMPHERLVWRNDEQMGEYFGQTLYAHAGAFYDSQKRLLGHLYN